MTAETVAAMMQGRKARASSPRPPLWVPKTLSAAEILDFLHCSNELQIAVRVRSTLSSRASIHCIVPSVQNLWLGVCGPARYLTSRRVSSCLPFG